MFTASRPLNPRPGLCMTVCERKYTTYFNNRKTFVLKSIKFSGGVIKKRSKGTSKAIQGIYTIFPFC